MQPLAAVLAASAGFAAAYAAATGRDDRSLLAATASVVLLAMTMLVEGYTAAAAVQLSLAAGFLAAVGFLTPRLGGSEPGAYPGMGLAAALVVFTVLAGAAVALPGGEARGAAEGSGVLLALASLPLLAGLLGLRALIWAWRGR